MWNNPERESFTADLYFILSQESNTNTVTLKSITRLKWRSRAKSDEMGTFSVSRRFLQVLPKAVVGIRPLDEIVG